MASDRFEALSQELIETLEIYVNFKFGQLEQQIQNLEAELTALRYERLQ